jgi:Protein of unknown function (DUF2786)
MASSEVLDQINMILHKAEARGTTPEEAEMLTERAEKLMIKHGVQQAMLDAQKTGEQPREQIVEIRVQVKGTWREGDDNLAFAVGRGLGNVRVLHSRSRRWVNGKRVMHYFVYFIGFESDVARAIQLWESLKLQSYSAMSVWYEKNKHYFYGHEKFIERRSFLFGFAGGVELRLTRNRRTIHEEVSKEPGTALVLVGREEAVQNWMDETYPKLRNTKSRMQGGEWGYLDGHEAGLNARTGEREVDARGTRGAIGGAR